MRKILPVIAAAVVALAVSAAVLLTGGHKPTCPRPALLASGAYSSYRTQGTMPSGSTVRMSDGDLWTCRSGHVVVWS